LPRKKTFKATRTNALATSASKRELEQEKFPFEGAEEEFSIVNPGVEKPALEVVPKNLPKG